MAETKLSWQAYLEKGASPEELANRIETVLNRAPQGADIMLGNIAVVYENNLPAAYLQRILIHGHHPK